MASQAKSAQPSKAYKILTASQWQSWLSAPSKKFTGAGIDLSDGFIHLSTAAQAGTTYELFFAPAVQKQESCDTGGHLESHGEGLVVVEVDLNQVTDEVKWDVSRNGEEFPHVYGAIDMSAVRKVWEGSEVGEDLFRRLTEGNEI